MALCKSTWYYNWHVFDRNPYQDYEIYSLVYCNCHTAITILQNFYTLHGLPRQVMYILVCYGDNLPRWMYQKPHLLLAALRLQIGSSWNVTYVLRDFKVNRRMIIWCPRGVLRPTWSMKPHNLLVICTAITLESCYIARHMLNEFPTFRGTRLASRKRLKCPGKRLQALSIVRRVYTSRGRHTIQYV
jgi:hypothetical protein